MFNRSRKPYGWRLLIAVDQLLNVMLSPILNGLLPVGHKQRSLPLFGFEDETLSSVFGKNAPYVRWCYHVCRLLSLLDEDHCKKSIEKDEG